MANKVPFGEYIRQKYHIYSEKDSGSGKKRIFSISRIQILSLFILAFLLTFTISLYLILFTNIKEWILGFPSGNYRTVIVNNALLADSLEVELAKRDDFLHSLQIMIGGGEYGTDTTGMSGTALHDSIQKNSNRFDTILFRISQEEKDFREIVEEESRFSLGLTMVKNDREYIHFFPPVTGYITRSFNEREGHFGTDVVAKKDAQVMAVLDGVVMFTDWTVNTGHVVVIQHSNNLVSVYKHNSVVFCKQGDYVRTGQTIANVGNSGHVTSGPHLHFELWRAGSPLNPEDFIQFK